MIDRRFFLRSSLIASLLPTIGYVPVAFAKTRKSSARCQACTFYPLVGEVFTASMGESHIVLTLEEVTESNLGNGPIPAHIRTDPFSCLWKIEGDEVAEGMAEINHPKLGKVLAHLIPKWKKDGQRLYETIWG